MKMPRPQATLVATLAGLLMLLLAVPAAAAPEAHILRIDPRAAIDDGAAILTTVIELVQNRTGVQLAVHDLRACAHPADLLELIDRSRSS